MYFLSNKTKFCVFIQLKQNHPLQAVLVLLLLIGRNGSSELNLGMGTKKRCAATRCSIHNTYEHLRYYDVDTGRNTVISERHKNAFV